MDEIFNKEVFGAQLRQARIKAGYEKAEDFAEALSTKVGYQVSRQTIYNIESGKQEPKLSLYLAMERLLEPSRSLKPDRLVATALPKDWQLPLDAANNIFATLSPSLLNEATKQRFAALATQIADTVNTSVISGLQPVITELVERIDFSSISRNLERIINQQGNNSNLGESISRAAMKSSILNELAPDEIERAHY